MIHHNFEPLAKELAASLQSLLWQAEQMAGLFDDEDATISDAMAEAYDALKHADKEFNAFRSVNDTDELADACRLLIILEDSEAPPEDTRWKAVRKTMRKILQPEAIT
jgi:hypothetical protein